MSKRDLYKPAPSQTPPRLSRKSLTQGRLVSTDPRALLDNFSPSAPRVSIPTSQTVTPRARRSLDYHTILSSTTSEQHPPPYKITPTIVKSPAKVKPSSSLSLSDTEGETRNQTLNNKQESNEPITLNQPTVLTVDASQRHSSFKDKEVPITTSYVKSPVKVVCHSPMRHVSSNISMNEAQDGHAGKMKIPVDSVPRLNVLDTSISKANETQSSSSPPASEGSLSTVAGSPVDRRSKAIETVVVREPNNPRSYVSFLDEDDSLSTMDQSEIHVKQPKFDDTVISSITEDSTIGSFVDETRKKKRKPRVVQSKYMTSAMSRTGQKSSTIKRADPRPMSTKKTTSTISNQDSKKTKIKKNKTKTSLKPAVKEDEKAVESNRKKKATKPKFTSTPSEVTAQPVTNTGEQTPVINPATERFTFQEDSSLLPPSFFTPNKDQSQKKKTVKDLPVSYKEASTEHSSSNRPTKQAVSDMSKLQFQLLYARLCQWRFLRSKFKHTFEKQEKEAQEQMYTMWQLNEELRKKKCEMQMEFETTKKLDEVDWQLESQLSSLKSIDCNSSKLFPDYNNLYEGIDTTRHHIVVKDVMLADNEADLLAALDSCENTLGEITSLLQADQAKVLSFSEEMGILADTVQEETKERDRCIELLAAASTLTTHEKSLQAELIQRKEP